MIEETSTEQKELRIDTEEGLRDFWVHTTELYTVLRDIAEQQSSSNEASRAYLQQADLAFKRANEVTEMCLRSLALGIPLNDVLVAEIQQQYNEIATAYDLFVIEATPVPQEEIPSSVMTEVNTFLTAATTLREKARTLLTRYEDITTIITGKDELSIGQFYYNQLAAAEKVIASTEGTIMQQQELLATSTTFQESVTSTLQELDTKLNTLDKELDRFFEPDEEPEVVTATPMEMVEEKNTRTTEFSAILDSILLEERFALFVEEHFHSRSQLELKLRREVARIEAPSKFDMMLGVRHASAFAFLRDMTIEEVLAFDSAPRVVIRGELAAKDIPYEIYVEWMYILNDIQMILNAPHFVTFGELFVRAELELMYQERVTESEAAL
ncbi:MAG: hypothetical protein RLZZ480_655 [Candidatus Parcubacteria bacterium]|jgi:hypothetical protein